MRALNGECLKLASDLDGCWRTGDGTVCTITGGVVMWPNGKQVPISLGVIDVSMLQDGQRYQASLVGGCLHWNDGDTWSRQVCVTPPCKSSSLPSHVPERVMLPDHYKSVTTANSVISSPIGYTRSDGGLRNTSVLVPICGEDRDDAVVRDHAAHDVAMPDDRVSEGFGCERVSHAAAVAPLCGEEDEITAGLVLVGEGERLLQIGSREVPVYRLALFVEASSASIALAPFAQTTGEAIEAGDSDDIFTCLAKGRFPKAMRLRFLRPLAKTQLEAAFRAHLSRRVSGPTGPDDVERLVDALPGAASGDELFIVLQQDGESMDVFFASCSAEPSTLGKRRCCISVRSSELWLGIQHMYLDGRPGCQPALRRSLVRWLPDRLFGGGAAAGSPSATGTDDQKRVASHTGESEDAFEERTRCVLAFTKHADTAILATVSEQLRNCGLSIDAASWTGDSPPFMVVSVGRTELKQAADALGNSKFCSDGSEPAASSHAEPTKSMASATVAPPAEGTEIGLLPVWQPCEQAELLEAIVAGLRLPQKVFVAMKQAQCHDSLLGDWSNVKDYNMLEFFSDAGWLETVVTLHDSGALLRKPDGHGDRKHDCCRSRCGRWWSLAPAMALQRNFGLRVGMHFELMNELVKFMAIPATLELLSFAWQS